MKKIITTVMALTLALGMSVTALADQSPVKTKTDAALASTGTATEQEVAAAEEALATEKASFADASEATKESAKAGVDALIADKTIEVNDNQEANIIDVFDVTVPPAVGVVLAKGGSVDITWSMNWDTTGTIVVLHFNGATWEKVPTTVNGRTVTATFTSLSPVAFVEIADKAATTPAETPSVTYNGWAGVDMAALWAAQTQAGATSPKTGEAGVLGFALIAVACGAALVVTKKKFA